MPNKRAGRGSPAAGARGAVQGLGEQMLLRVSTDDKRLFREAATEDSFTSVSEWLRWVARTRARAVLGRAAGAAAGSVRSAGGGRRVRVVRPRYGE